MIFQKHTYDFPETYLCFFKNTPMFFQGDWGVLSQRLPCVSLRALFQAFTVTLAP